MGKGVENMEWQTYQKTMGYQKYEKYMGKPFLIVHPTGTAYLPPKLADRLGDYYVMINNKNFAGFRKSEKLDPNAYALKSKGKGTLRQLGTKDWLIRSKLLVPDKIAVYLAEEVGDIIMVNVSLGPSELLPYTKRTTITGRGKIKHNPPPLTPPDNVTSVEIVPEESKKLQEEHRSADEERQHQLEAERKKLMEEYTKSF